MKSKASEILTLLESDNTNNSKIEQMKTTLSKIIKSKSSEDAVEIWSPLPPRPRRTGGEIDAGEEAQLKGYGSSGQTKTPTVTAVAVPNAAGSGAPPNK
jgi:hypothetical protein